MKHSLLYLAIAISLTACNSDPKKDLKTDVTVLTPGNNPGAYSTALSDTATTSKEIINDEDANIPATVKRRVVKQPRRQSQSSTSNQNTGTVYQPQAPVVNQPLPEPVVVPNTTQTSGESTSTDNTGSTPAAIPEIKQEKKGWSKAAQGAVIGGVAGAVGGAIISKNKGKGAIIGGVVGAAGGYILGRSKDKKEASTNFVSN